ncbi:MAG TPA: OmpA family protein, partial [Gammaproteobacteria bacterium]|nr:OmpA family protein [Gammaproteobacteria bacterium]
KKIATVFKHGNLSGKTILIEGHADASGSETYNLELSRNRADAVRRFLEQNEQVDNLNFYVEGKGESDLFNPLDPYAAENRRVEFVVGAAGGRK